MGTLVSFELTVPFSISWILLGGVKGTVKKTGSPSDLAGRD